MIVEYFISALHVLSQARSYARKNNDLALSTIHLVSWSSSSYLIKLWRRIKRSFAHSIWWPGWNPHGRNRSFGFSYSSIIHTYQNILFRSINKNFNAEFHYASILIYVPYCSRNWYSTQYRNVPKQNRLLFLKIEDF